MFKLLKTWLKAGKRDTGGVIMLVSFLLQQAGIADATTENIGLIGGALIHAVGWIHFLVKKYIRKA